MFVRVTAMSLTLKSRATTSARSIMRSDAHNSVRAERPVRNSHLRTSPRRPLVRRLLAAQFPQWAELPISPRRWPTPNTRRSAAGRP